MKNFDIIIIDKKYTVFYVDGKLVGKYESFVDFMKNLIYLVNISKEEVKLSMYEAVEGVTLEEFTDDLSSADLSKLISLGDTEFLDDNIIGFTLEDLPVGTELSFNDDEFTAEIMIREGSKVIYINETLEEIEFGTEDAKRLELVPYVITRLPN